MYRQNQKAFCLLCAFRHLDTHDIMSPVGSCYSMFCAKAPQLDSDITNTTGIFAIKGSTCDRKLTEAPIGLRPRSSRPKEGNNVCRYPDRPRQPFVSRELRCRRPDEPGDCNVSPAAICNIPRDFAIVCDIFQARAVDISRAFSLFQLGDGLHRGMDFWNQEKMGEKILHVR